MPDVRGSNLRSRVPERSGVDCADILFGLRLRRRRRRQTAHRQLLQASLISPPGRDSNPGPATPQLDRNSQAEAENLSTDSRQNDFGVDENAASLSILSHEDASVQSNDGREEVDRVRVSGTQESTSAGRLFPEACDERSLSECGNEEYSAIAEIFKCFICLCKVVDAQMCPCCSKLVCSPCIRHWLLEQKSQCPHCRMPLFVSQLVNCKFISEITEELDKMCGKANTKHSDKICLIHDSPLSYFCLTCSSPVCSDCAVLDEDHHNHSFERLIATYSRHKKKINQEAVSLRQRLQELSSLVKAIDENTESVLKAKDASLEELQKSYESIQKRLEEQLKCKLSTLLAQKGSITNDMELVETVLHEVDNQLNKLPKLDLIAQEPMICNMLQDIRTRTLTEGQQTPVSTKFDSEKAFASGVTWHLKVYSNGSGAFKGAHISSFKRCLTEMKNHLYMKILSRCYIRAALTSMLCENLLLHLRLVQVGGWGYHEFFLFDLLETEGYFIPKEDAITFRFYVRASS